MKMVIPGGGPNKGGSTSVDNFQTQPNQLYVDAAASQAATAVNDTVIHTTNDVSVFNYHIIENTSSTDAVTVQISIDGTNFSGDAAVQLHDSTAPGTTLVTSIPSGDFGILKGGFRKIRFLKDGTTNEAPSVRFAHKVI